ncbi:tetratricopeptide repeat protein [Aliiglaciecola lipolytica]|uniref:Cytochrome c-type biogenesis protein H TPR domain-containing protein n=1 Tax=Aliiglaciecola lipolytica E3 TaxID=1127673 RepID=K6XM52_9ALTE|nr:tetratricopeptide repeat protein [Aliiglaciecola lipolytica]GAC12741.1 hypothetical protein GLIP_0086 [Aliiglaciecola lipolytica E3]
MKLIRYCLLLSNCIILNNAFGEELINTGQVPVILPTFNKPFLQREAKISAQEYPLAQTLKPYLENENYQPALKLLAEYKETKSPALLLLEAQLRMQQEEFKEAEKLLKLALEDMPDFIRAHLALASVYQFLHKSKEAQLALSQAISLGASGATHFAQLGYLNMQNNDSQSAIAAYQHALMLAPENMDIRQGLLFALVQSAQHNAARNLLTGMLHKQPENHQFWLQRASLALQAGDKNMALSSVEVAIRLGGESKQARNMAMQLNIQLKNYQRALDLSLLMLQEQQLEFIEIEKLLSWLVSNDEWHYVEALLDGTSVLGLTLNQTQQSQLLYFRGQIARQNQVLSEAKKTWKQAIKLDPSNGNALLALAKLMAFNAAFAEADLYYQRAEKLPELALPAKLGRAQLYVDQHDYEAALSLLQRTHSEYPHRHDLLKNIRILSNLVNSQQTI